MLFLQAFEYGIWKGQGKIAITKGLFEKSLEVRFK